MDKNQTAAEPVPETPPPAEPEKYPVLRTLSIRLYDDTIEALEALAAQQSPRVKRTEFIRLELEKIVRSAQRKPA